MTFLEARSYLDSFINYELKSASFYPSFQLDRVKQLFAFLGHPEEQVKYIHIAGTNGKGSTCAFLTYILREAGFKVGLYTSPHFNDLRERIRVLSPGSRVHQEDPFEGKITEEEFCRVLEGIVPSVEKIRARTTDLGHLTYFEILTAVAVCYFAERQVDFAVLETGLGGRLDATNAVDPLLCGLTHISIEHTAQLGMSLQEIAKEKAAIIKKKGQPVVVAPQETGARDVVQSRCREFDAQVIFLGEDIRYELVSVGCKGQEFKIERESRSDLTLKTRLLGKHQRINAAMAVAMAEILQTQGYDISQNEICSGVEKTQWPGRFEVTGENPLVILDGAHNLASCRSLVEVLKEVLPQKKITFILGMSRDKNIPAICAELNQVASCVILTKAKHPRAYEFSQKEGGALFPGKKVFISENTAEAFDIASRQTCKKDAMVVTGSLFVVSEARERCINQVVKIR